MYFLLDVEKNPQRPAYGMAADYPLNLFSCDYDGVEWNYDQVFTITILCVNNKEKIKNFCFVRPYSVYLEIKKSRTVNLDAYIFFILWKYLV